MLVMMCCICKEKSGQVSVTVRARKREMKKGRKMDVSTSQIKSRPGVYNCDAQVTHSDYIYTWYSSVGLLCLLSQLTKEILS